MLPSHSILLGQYRPLDSFLHRLDARAKIIPVLMIMILGLGTESFLFYLLVLGALLIGLMASGVGMGSIARNARSMVIIVAITFGFHLFFSGADTPVAFEFLGMEFRTGALRSGAFFSLRLILFLSVAFLITLTSSPSDMAEAIRRLLAPLKKIRVPIDNLGLILFMALRFVPILHDEVLAIKQAQMIRGVRFTGSLVTRIRRASSLLTPVFVAAMGRADELALAMQARGFRSGQPRTTYTQASFGSREWTFMLGSCLSAFVLFYVTR